MLDLELTFSHHINLIAWKCYYQLRQLRVVFRSLTHQSTLALVLAFVTSRIDCCCSLLAGPLIGLPWLGSVVSCSPCWEAAEVVFYHCLHARCTTLAADLSADTVSYHCNGLSMSLGNPSRKIPPEFPLKILPRNSPWNFPP